MTRSEELAKQEGVQTEPETVDPEAAKENVPAGEGMVSEDGSDVAVTEQWTTQAARDALSQAVTGAGASDQDGTPQSKVDAAAQSLKDAVSAFENARKAGANAVLIGEALMRAPDKAAALRFLKG